MTLTMGDDRSGEFSNSSRVKIKGEITMNAMRPIHPGEVLKEAPLFKLSGNWSPD
jgi:hypothetical protein